MNATGILSAFEADLRQAIANGRLQEILDRVNPESPVYIVSPIKEGEDDDVDRVITDDSNNGISGGLISGIVIGGMVGLLLTMALFSRRRQDHDSEEYFLKENQSADVQDHIAENKLESNSPPAVESESNIEVNTSDEADVEDAVATAAVVGATVAATRFSKSKKADQSMDKDSDAGSSGWSSREGLSSLEEGSNADQESKTSEAASSTRSITPSIPREETMESADPDGAGLHLTYSELDQAIQKGDWAAVGVTAALLASQSNVGSSSSPEKKVNFSGDLPPNRAAELDRLVEAGDWAGVVAAAAKFDAQESQQGSVGSVRSEPGSSTGSAYSGSGTSPTIGSGAFTSTGTSNSDSGSRVKKLDELRAEVEMLVAKVVPEEKDNIEEMLMQFRGREEELVETLRTMQEREVAQKARREGHKRAKRDARQTVEQNKLHQQHGAGVENLERPTDENWIQEIENTPSDPEIVVSTSQEVLDQMEAPQEDDEDREVLAMQNLLKQAIESEDWDKVAETAAGLSGRFVDTGDDDDQDDASTKSSDHSAEINELVEKGDWDGVVVAASKHAESEQTSSSDTPEEVARRARREQRLKEEQDALEQADIWRAIAEQTKSEHAETEAEANRAATVAADWAIARSLSELNAADKAGKLSDLEKGSDSSSGDDDQDATI